MTEARKGRQTPTRCVVLPYTQSAGEEASALYERTGRHAQDWQQLLIEDILGTNADGLWTHVKYGYSVPRRNGKSEILLMRAIYGLEHGERILYTAHRTTTSHSMWEKLCQMLESSSVGYKSVKQFGLERIKTRDGLINFRTRTASGGLGEGYDLLIIDEAQEYTTDQETALKYVVSDSQNPQTLLCGTPPTAVSAGTVFSDLRRDALQGVCEDTGWAEWSVERQTLPGDVDAWYETNPSMGSILTERKIRAEISNNDVDFNVQRLGLWLTYSQKSAVSRAEWEALAEKALPELTGPLYAGVKFGKDGEHASLSIAVRTADKRIFVEAIDCRPIRSGIDWIVDFLRKASPAKVAVDGASGQNALADLMKEAKLKPPTLPSVREIIAANAMWEPAIEARTIAHMNQPSLTQIVSNCERRVIGSNGGYGYRSILEGADVSLLDSAILAHWLCAQNKPAKRQRITY